MKIKSAWFFAAILMLGLATSSVSCMIIEPANAPIPVASIAPPNIPHRLEGRSDCRICHATGVAGAPQFPADHHSRPSDVCLDCHRPAAGLYAANETIPWPNAMYAGQQPPATTPAPTTTPPSGTTTTPPATSPPAAASGKDLFATNCSPCHGANRQGTPGLAPPLNATTLASMSDAQITDTITNGRTGTAMPPFKSSLTADQIASIVAFIKTPAQ